MEADDSIEVIHDAAHRRFIARIDGETPRLEYRLAGGVMDIHHTEVPASLGGRGIAGRLVEAAIAYARGNGLRVRTSCSYARRWMQRNPASLDLLAPDASRG